MKVLKYKNSDELASCVIMSNWGGEGSGWYAGGVSCGNPDYICEVGEEEENGFEVVEMTQEEFEAALEKMGVEVL